MLCCTVILKLEWDLTSGKLYSILILIIVGVVETQDSWHGRKKIHIDDRRG